MAGTLELTDKVMPPAGRSPVPHAVVLSRRHPFSTLHLSDFEGPSQRQRLVVRQGPLPDWLRQYAALLGLGFDCVAVAMGKARLGSQTRIQSIVVYPAQPSRPEVAYVYVAEQEERGRVTPSVRPVHVVRCSKLPETVHFVEVPQSRGPRASLKVLETLATQNHGSSTP